MSLCVLPARLLLLAALLSACSSQPVRPPQALPASKILDMHAHIAGYGNGGSGCYVSLALRNNYRFDLFLRGFGVSRKEIEQQGDSLVVDRLAERLRASQHVGAMVLLALDGVVDTQGELDLAHSELYIPNEYVAAQAARYPGLFYWGASVNPYRKDALPRLRWAKEHGAVLVKWLPNIQQIDPADPRLVAFYAELVRLRLPLLSHTGNEHSFSHSSDGLGDPQRLQLPLSLGVTVIAAHVASTGHNHGEDNFQRLLPLFARYPNLYADISSLTQINKLGYLNRALQQPDLSSRLLYGSDYPLSNMILSSPWYFPGNLGIGTMYRLAHIRNPMDRDVALKQALGVPTAVFAHAPTLLGLVPPVTAAP